MLIYLSWAPELLALLKGNFGFLLFVAKLELKD